MTITTAYELTRDAPRSRECEPPPCEWIIQRCLDAFRNEYEDWPGVLRALADARGNVGVFARVRNTLA